MAAQPEYRKFEQPPAPKWRRILVGEEVFLTQESDHQPGRMYGYWCKAGVLLKGHETCTCDRAQKVQEVRLFCAHPPNYKFPLHYDVMQKLVDHVSDDGQFGFNDSSIGALVRRPTYALYGYLLPTHLRDVWWSNRW